MTNKHFLMILLGLMTATRKMALVFGVFLLALAGSAQAQNYGPEQSICWGDWGNFDRIRVRFEATNRNSDYDSNITVNGVTIASVGRDFAGGNSYSGETYVYKPVSISLGWVFVGGPWWGGYNPRINYGCNPTFEDAGIAPIEGTFYFYGAYLNQSTLSVSKSASPYNLKVGATGQSYTIAVSISNTATTTPTHIYDTLPAGITTAGTITASGGQVLGCPAAGASNLTGCYIPAGSIGTVYINVPIDVGSNTASVVTNTAYAYNPQSSNCTGQFSCPGSSTNPVSPALPTLFIQQSISASTSTPGPYTFSYTGSNGVTPKQITSTALYPSTTNSPIDTLSAINTATSVTLARQAGWFYTWFRCADLNAASTGNPSGILTAGQVNDTVTIPAQYVNSGSAFICEVGLGQSSLTLFKTLGGNRIHNNDQFTVQIKDATGTVVNNTIASSTRGTGNTVDAGTGTTGVFGVTPNSSYTLTEVMASGSVSALAQYSASISCSNARSVANGGTDVSGITTLGSSVTPKDGDVITCVVSNTPRPAVLSLSKALGGAGRVGANDQFTLEIRAGGINGTAMVSTVTSGANGNVTGTATLNPTAPNTAYTLAEFGANGANLAQYTTTLTCADSANLQGGLPTAQPFDPNVGFTLTPVAGANIGCTLTNSPSALPVGISGRVFLDVGRGAGVPNDGVLNGSELPIAGVRVQLTNCGSTIYAQTLTNSQGQYSFQAPNVAVGAPLCVAETNASGLISTGASVGNTALPSGNAVNVSGTRYTYQRGTDQIAFTWNGTGHTDLNFGDVPQSSFVPNGAKTAAPGTTTTFAHTFTAGTAGTVAFSVSNSVATPSLIGWSERIFADPTCSGSLQPGAAQLYPPLGPGIAVSAQQQVCVVVQEFVPANAQVGDKNEATILAAFSLSNANPALSTQHTVTDVTLVGHVSLNLLKEVRNITQNGSFGANNEAKSGDVLEYRITYTNTAPAVLTNLAVHDTTPVYTTFVSSEQGSTPATLTTCSKTTPANPAPASAVPCATVQSPGGSGAVIWTFTGALPGSGSGQVLFQVKVD